jgi:hypothetical protein
MTANRRDEQGAIVTGANYDAYLLLGGEEIRRRVTESSGLARNRRARERWVGLMTITRGPKRRDTAKRRLNAIGYGRAPTP